eukprot:GHVU01217344.1.p1 GENE.GHVU01217344.1~~GHVU01217344.1.p1  ORF type:complete len:333 (-),score=11.21 GHVU01217344.1:621-1619(-)
MSAQLRIQYIHPQDIEMRPVTVVDTELTLVEFLALTRTRFGAKEVVFGGPFLGGDAWITPALIPKLTRAMFLGADLVGMHRHSTGPDVGPRIPQNDMAALITASAKGDDETLPHDNVHEHRRLPMHSGEPLTAKAEARGELPPFGSPDTPTESWMRVMNDIFYPPLRLVASPEAHPLGQDFLWTSSGLWRPRYRSAADGQGRPNEIHGRSSNPLPKPLGDGKLPRVVFLQPMNREGTEPRPITPFPVELVEPQGDEWFPWLDLKEHSRFNWNGLPRLAVYPVSGEVEREFRGRREASDARRQHLLESHGWAGREDEHLRRHLEIEEGHGFGR